MCGCRSQEKRKKGKEEGVFFDGQVGTYKGGAVSYTHLTLPTTGDV